VQQRPRSERNAYVAAIVVHFARVRGDAVPRSDRRAIAGSSYVALSGGGIAGRERLARRLDARAAVVVEQRVVRDARVAEQPGKPRSAIATVRDRSRGLVSATAGRPRRSRNCWPRSIASSGFGALRPASSWEM
jgi:hypothetical protein